MKPAAALSLGLLLLAACGGTEPRTVPNVTGLDLRAADARLEARGIGVDVHGGGAVGIILRSRWQVCEQIPRPGAKAAEVALVVERACSLVAPVRSAVVPDVEYEPLDEAEDELRRAGLGYRVHAADSIVVRSNWTVCRQSPAPGEWGGVVELDIERGDCW